MCVCVYVCVCVCVCVCDHGPGAAGGIKGKRADIHVSYQMYVYVYTCMISGAAGGIKGKRADVEPGAGRAGRHPPRLNR